MAETVPETKVDVDILSKLDDVKKDMTKYSAEFEIIFKLFNCSQLH